MDQRDRQPEFAEALALELTHLAIANGGPVPPSTIFVGGGTPSLLRPHLWSGILLHLRHTFPPDAATEFTVECNPETVTPDLMHTLAAAGVNRVSLGAQSFNAAHLTTLERHHDPANVERALTAAAAAGIRRLSIDLIFGIPGQTLDDWRDDLRVAIRLADGALEHVSCYGLTYEPGTAMTRRLQLGHINRIDEDTEADMFELTIDLLGEAGLHRYEISNFARPGAECRHNLAYWRHEDWLGAGPSAASHASGFRWKNVPRLTDWVDGVAGRLDGTPGFSPIVDLEEPDPRRALAEMLLMGLRLAEGIDATEPAAHDRLVEAADRHADAGLLDVNGPRWRLTARGFMLADTVIGDLMNAVTAE